MTDEYKIITNRELRSKTAINGQPATQEQLAHPYLRTIYEAITPAHEKAIREGDLEDITTTFKK